MKRWVCSVALVVATIGCFPSRGISAVDGPALDATQAGLIAQAADEIKTAAFEQGRADGLVAAFRGRALKALTNQVERFALHHLRLEERNRVVAVVFWDARALEAVLEVRAQHRLVAPGRPNPQWAATVRQWWSRLGYVDGMWWVVDQEDLPPDKWRTGPMPAQPIQPPEIRFARTQALTGCVPTPALRL